ncbi:MAG: hypothetical protein MPJ50_15455 [Pirellulales bacterium]|nr:hypothetical protein [Pirellulales bacterium]
MDSEIHHEEKVYRVKVDQSGRILIPAGSQLRQTCRSGQELVAVESGNGSFVIRKYEDVVRELQAYFGDKIPVGRNLVAELTAERREEAARE